MRIWLISQSRTITIAVAMVTGLALLRALATQGLSACTIAGSLLFVRLSDIYFPVLHHVAPLIIGIALLKP